MFLFIFLELTLRDVVADIPHDAGAVIVYALFALFVAFVWAGSRRRGDLPPRSIAGGHHDP